MPSSSEANEEEPLVCRIVYSSRAVEVFGADALVDLLTLAREKNGRLGVSGMLLYAFPTFL